MENFDTKLAARYIGKSASWLNKTCLSGPGPTYLKIGGGVRYLRPDLDEWLTGKRRTAVYDFANDNAAARSTQAA